MDELRRRITTALLTGGIIGWLGSILYPVISFLKPPVSPDPVVNSVKAATVNEMAPNSGRIIRFGRQPVVLIRLTSGEFRAFSAVCTHLDCIVQYRSDLEHIWCACHNGHYDLRGRNIAGPPPRPLDVRYDVSVLNDDVIISRPSIAS